MLGAIYVHNLTSNPSFIKFHIFCKIIFFVLTLLCYGLNCMPPNSYAEVLIPNAVTFGERAFREVFKVK